MKIYTFLIAFALLFSLTGCTEPPETPKNSGVTDDKVESMIDDPEFLSDYMKEMDKDVALVDESIALEDDEKIGKESVGSCDDIASESTCVEYYGSFWTASMIEAECDGTFSTEPCPQDMAGGCNTGNETMTDAVAWMYFRGEGGITAQTIQYAKMACEMAPNTKWILTK